MILKIQRYTEEQWYILDNIRKVSISKALLKRPMCRELADICIFDMPDSGCNCNFRFASFQH